MKHIENGQQADRNTHQTHVQLFIDNYDLESKELYCIDLRSFTLEILCFEAFSHCYYAPPMSDLHETFMLVKSHLKHVFTQFCKVLDFRSGFIGLWLYVARPHF